MASKSGNPAGEVSNRTIMLNSKIDGLILVETGIHKDERGFFTEAFNSRRHVGLPSIWAQDNLSFSKKNVLRGMHYQRRNPQGKLVQCVSGKIYDACIDLRVGPTYLNWHAEILTPGRSMYVPPGCAHGYLALEDSLVYYKCTTHWEPDDEDGLYAFAYDIDWPPADYIMSAKDKGYRPKDDPAIPITTPPMKTHK